MGHVWQLLDRILAWSRDHGRPVAKLLAPGLDDEQMEVLQGKLGWRLPSQAIELFRWRNGLIDDAHVPLGHLHFFPWYYLVSFEEAIDTIKTYRDEGLWRPRWFPIFASGAGDFIILDCTRGDTESGPVLAFLKDHPEQPHQYSSLATMLETLAECFARDAFFLDERGYMGRDLRKQAAIALGFNPEIEFWRKYLAE